MERSFEAPMWSFEKWGNVMVTNLSPFKLVINLGSSNIVTFQTYWHKYAYNSTYKPQPSILNMHSKN
jgi:hypothetical protein